MKQARGGFSLLEVILALAIFAMAVAAVGELVRLGLRNAGYARDITRAQLHCESVMAELVSEVLPLASVSNQTIEIDPVWQYSVEIGSTNTEGLVAVTVSVSRTNPLPTRVTESVADRFTLVRWMPDPQYTANLEAAAEAAETSATSTGTTP